VRHLLLLLPALLALDAPPPPVVGGQDAPPDAAPFTVALLDGDQLVCAGVLLAPDVVLTAAHCTITADTVLAGTLTLDGPGERRAIDAVSRHPDWSSDTGLDVAVLSLDAPVDGVPTAILAGPCDTSIQPDQAARVYGWGSTQSDGLGYSSTLQQGPVTVTDPACTADSACRDVPGGELLASAPSVDACVGDSGGPLVDADGVVIGLVARGVDGETACGPGGVYTRTDALGDWLGDAAGLELDAERCPGGCGCASSASFTGWVVLLGLPLWLRRRRATYSRH